MKRIIGALVLLVMVSSCLPEKKSKVDPEPDLAGSYQVSQLVSGSQTYNLPDGRGSSAVAVIKRPTDSQIEVIVNSTENGSTTSDSFGTLTIRKASGKDYDVLNPNTSARIGSINGTDFSLDFISSGKRFALFARK